MHITNNLLIIQCFAVTPTPPATPEKNVDAKADKSLADLLNENLDDLMEVQINGRLFTFPCTPS